MKKSVALLFASFAITALIGCNDNKPTPAPSETYYNIEIIASGATFGESQREYYKGQIKKNTGFTTTFKAKDKFEPLKQSSFTVKIGGQESIYGWRFNNNSFTLDDSAVTGDIKITCTTDPIEPTETYKINNELKHSHDDTEYPLPTEVNKGEPVYGYLVADENYRLPNPDDKKHAKDSSIEVLSNSRRLERGSDYFYDIQEDGSARFYIPSEIIEENITIKGEGIRLYSVSFNPVSKIETIGDGHWIGGGTTSKSITFDEGTTIDEAFRKTGAQSPESDKKDQGYRFNAWTDESGKAVPSTHVIEEAENNTTYYGSYVQSQCYINFEELYNLMPVQDYPHKFKEEIRFTLQPQANYVLPLNKDFVLKRKDPKTQEVTIMVEGEDKDYTYTLDDTRKKADFVINASSVIGNFHVYGRCPEYYNITIDPNGGTIGEKKTPWDTHAVQGDKLSDLLEQEGITADPLPPEGEHFTGWTFNGASIDKDYQFTVSGTLKATYGNESFETVSWSKLAGQTATMTFEKLKTYYGVDSFIGMEKKITTPINGDQSKTREVMVRVIGENHDTKTDDNKALLTFEFEEIINKSVAYWTDNTYWNEYEHSELRKEMANESTMLETLNNFTIATVKKETMRGGKDDAKYKDQVETTEKLFALSGVEIGISGEQPREKMNPDTTTYTTSRFKEGSVYSYYSASQVKPSMREKDWLKPAEGEEPAQYIPTSYLLRTPHALSFTDPVAKKDQSGYYGIFGSSESQFKDKNGRYDRFHDTAIGIAPAFAI